MDQLLYIPVKGHCKKIETLIFEQRKKDERTDKKNAFDTVTSTSRTCTDNIITHKDPKPSRKSIRHSCPACNEWRTSDKQTSNEGEGQDVNIILCRPKSYIMQTVCACWYHTMESRRRKGYKFNLKTSIPCLHFVPFLSFLDRFIKVKVFVYGDRILLKRSRQYVMLTKLQQVMDNRDVRQRASDVLLDVAVACYLVALSNINLIEGLKETTTSITSTAVTNTATFGIEQAAQIVGNTAASTAVSAVVDVAISSAMLYIAKRQRDEGVISDKEFTTKIKKTVFKSTIKIAASATGSIIGQAVIPVPVVGGLVGGFCGSLIGTGIAKGVNYGLFERGEKKMKEEMAKQKAQDNEKVEHELKTKFGHRKLRGHVPKITIYNDNTKQFEEKVFEKDVGKYLKQHLKSDLHIGISPSRDKSPTPRRKEQEGNSGEEYLHANEYSDVMTKLKAIKQSIPTIPIKKSNVTEKEEAVDTADQENEETAHEDGPKLALTALCEESLVDVSAVLAAHKKDTIENRVENTEEIVDEALLPARNQNSPVKNKLSGINLQNLRDAFSSKKNKNERNKPTVNENIVTGKNVDVSICEDNAGEMVDEATNEEEEMINDGIIGKRNFIGNLFQQIKTSNSFRGNKFGTEINAKEIDEGSSNVYDDNGTDNVIETRTDDILTNTEFSNNDVSRKVDDYILVDSDDVICKEDGAESNILTHDVDLTRKVESNINELQVAEGGTGIKNWQLFKLFKEPKELGNGNIDRTASPSKGNEVFQELDKTETILLSVEDDIPLGMEGSTFNSYPSSVKTGDKPNTDCKREEINDIDSNSLLENKEDGERTKKKVNVQLSNQMEYTAGLENPENPNAIDSDESLPDLKDRLERKPSIGNFFQNVYGQLERKMSGNPMNNFNTSGSTRRSSERVRTSPGRLGKASNESVCVGKANENAVGQTTSLTEVKEVDVKQKKNSYFDRVKTISKIKVFERGNR